MTDPLHTQLLGLTQDHLVELDDGHFIHRDSFQDFTKLQLNAEQHDITIRPISSFRNFNHQLRIWNKKMVGLIPIMDHYGNNPLNFDQLSEEQKVLSILRWSALPGLSRHHWGTDLDLIDLRSIEGTNYQVKLEPHEYESGGPFEKLNNLLSDLYEKGSSFGFYRPFQSGEGIGPEAWHWSHWPVAKSFQTQLDLEKIGLIFSNDLYEEVEGIEWIRENQEKIFSQFITPQLHIPWP